MRFVSFFAWWLIFSFAYSLFSNGAHVCLIPDTPAAFNQGTQRKLQSQIDNL